SPGTAALAPLVLARPVPEPVASISSAVRPAPTAAPARISEEHRFVTSDGTGLFYRAWPPSRPADQAVVLFHPGHDQSARWQDFVDRIDLEDCWFFAWDARGHGRSPGERGYAPSFARMVKDADEFVQHITSQHGIPLTKMAVVGQSVGAVLAATWVHDY